ncbi:MAG: hypothetical protein IJN90_01140 [Bacilli bacterium]|nr:hypothetical protein [Bacilli bacterium]
MATDYEKLKKDGYEEEEIHLHIEDPLSKVVLSDAPMSEGREDKSASISDSQGHSMKTSSVMMGYNKKGLNLPSGEYVSADELEAAMTGFLTQDSENKVIVCRSTGARVDVSTLTGTVIEGLVAGAGLTLVGTSEKITNQTAYTYGIRGDTKQTRVFMAGNKGFQMPNGEYVSEEELEKAMADYLYMVKKDKPIIVPPIILPPSGDGEEPGKEKPENEPKGPVVPPVIPGGEHHIPTDEIPEEKSKDPEPKEDEEKEEENERRTVVARRKWPDWRLIAAAVGTALIFLVSTLGLSQDVIEKRMTEIHQNATYQISQMSEEQVYENIDQVIQRAISDHNTGDTVYVEEGVRYDHESDRTTDKHGIIGEGLRQEGNYTLEYISILDENGNIIKVETQEGVNLGETIQETLETRGLEFSDVEVRVHIGGPVAGWIDAKDILTADELTPQLIEEKFVVESVYEGSVENFDGTINIQTGNGSTTLDVISPTGEVKEGQMIVGSDGQTYQVDNLDIETVETTTVTEELGKKHLTMSLDNHVEHGWYAAIAETILLSGIMTLGVIQKKKKEEEEKAEKEFAEAEYKGKFDEVAGKVNAINQNKTFEDMPPTIDDTPKIGGRR